MFTRDILFDPSLDLLQLLRDKRSRGLEDRIVRKRLLIQLGRADLSPLILARRKVQCCFTSTETLRTIREGELRTATSTFTQLLSSAPEKPFVQCCFTCTETVRAIRDGELRTTTSTFTQLQSSVCVTSSSVLLYVHRNHKAY